MKTFFEKFDLFADSPKAVPKMRAVVRYLAIAGKLVSQEPNDEPAEILFEKIEAEKSRRLRVGTLRNLKEPLPIADSDKEFDLPFNWQWVRTGQVVKLWNGFAFKSGDFQQDGIPVIRIGDLQSGLVNISSAVCVSEDVAQMVGPEFWIPEDALLIAMSGATTGKVAFNKTGRKLLLNQRVGRLEPILVKTEYVRFFFETIVARNLSISSGSAIPNLSAEQINETLFPLPPLAEQKRIVGKVDELMALCDRLESQQKEREMRHAALAHASLARFADAPTPANLDFIFHKSYDIAPADLRKAILTLAVQGKLVPQDPNDESVATLIAGLAQLRRELLTERKIRNQKVSDSPTPSDLPFDIPDGWRWIRFGEAVTLLGGYAYESGAYVPMSSNQIIRLGNVKNDALLLDQKPAFILDALAEQTAEFAIREGDILITMTGTKAKRDYAFTLAVKPSDLVERRLFLNQRVGAIRPFRSELVPLINMFLKSDQLLDLMFATATGTANQANIGTGSILDLPFPLPPLAEQRRIVAKVDGLMALVDALETQVATARTTAEKLMEAVVAELTVKERVIPGASRSSVGSDAVFQTPASGAGQIELPHP